MSLKPGHPESGRGEETDVFIAGNLFSVLRLIDGVSCVTQAAPARVREPSRPVSTTHY